MKTAPIDRLKLSAASRNVWLFGAGASHVVPYELPLQSNMLRHFMTLPRPGNDGAKASLADLRTKVTELISAVLPGASPDTVTLEELFSAYELQASHLHSSDEEVRDARQAIRALQRALFVAVQEFGRGDSAKWLPHQRGNTQAPYAELLERLFPIAATAEQLRRHTLSTMNYDINLDRCALSMREKEAGEVDLDYGFELANYRIPNSFSRPRERSILLLRLHGSVNWLRCLACQAVFTTVRSQASFDERKNCDFCRTASLDRIMVHPSYLRSYTDPILQIVWGRLREELTASDRWIFVGYSFPEADVHLRDVLRHALRVRQRNKLPTVAVWAGYRSSSTDSNWDTEYARYHATFGDSLVPWNATGGGFSDFVRALDD